jgi:hypothetical protein
MYVLSVLMLCDQIALITVLSSFVLLCFCYVVRSLSYSEV